MKNVIALLLILGLGGCDLLASAPRRACNRMVKLCELKVEDADSCTEELAKVERSLGKERVDKLATCVKESTGCAEAGGCMAGTGVEALGDQMGKFMKGLGRVLK